MPTSSRSAFLLQFIHISDFAGTWLLTGLRYTEREHWLGFVSGLRFVAFVSYRDINGLAFVILMNGF